MIPDNDHDLIAALKDIESRFVSTPQQALLIPGLGDVRKSIAQAIHAFSNLKEIYEAIKQCRKELMDASQQAEQVRVLLNQALTVLRFTVSQLSFDPASESLSESEAEHLKATVSRLETLVFNLMDQGKSLLPIKSLRESMSQDLTQIMDRIHLANQASRIYDGQEGKLLILDHNLNTAESMQKRLAHEGYEVMMVTQPDVAISLLASGSVDVVLVDIQAAEEIYAPIMQEIFSHSPWGYISVIVVGDLSQLDALSYFLEQGADDLLIQPLNATLLKKRIRSSLEKKATYKIRQERFKESEKVKEELQQAIHALNEGFIAFDYCNRVTMYNDKIFTFFPHLQLLFSTHQDGAVITLEDTFNSILEAGVMDFSQEEGPLQEIYQAWYFEKLEACTAPAQLWEDRLLSGKIYQFTSYCNAEKGVILTLQDVSTGLNIAC